MFTPEFRNRLDAIVPFGYLPTESSRGWSTSSSSSSSCSWPTATSTSSSTTRRSWLTDKGYDKLYGARPMGRLIQEKIKQPLAEELLFGKLVHGGEVNVAVKDNALTFEITSAAPRRRKRGKKAKAAAAASDPADTGEPLVTVWSIKPTLWVLSRTCRRGP